MQRFVVVLWALLVTWLWFSFAANQSILDYSYTVDWNDVKIFRTDNSDWWNVDIRAQNPENDERLQFGTAKISDQTFTYTKQWDGDQKIWMAPDDGWEDIQFTIQWTTIPTTVTRTVIPVVPKAWPSGKAVVIVLITLVIFGGYIYIKKRADI